MLLTLGRRASLLVYSSLTVSFWKTASCSLLYPHLRQGQAPLWVLNKYLWKDRGKEAGKEGREEGGPIIYPLEKCFLLHIRRGNSQGMDAEECWEWPWKAGLLQLISKWGWDRTWRQVSWASSPTRCFPWRRNGSWYMRIFWKIEYLFLIIYKYMCYLKGLQIAWIPAIPIIILECLLLWVLLMIASTEGCEFTRQMRHKEKGKPELLYPSVFFLYLLFYFPAEVAGKGLIKNSINRTTELPHFHRSVFWGSWRHRTLWRI